MGQDLSIINSECKLCLKYTFNILEDTLKIFLNIYLFGCVESWSMQDLCSIMWNLSSWHMDALVWCLGSGVTVCGLSFSVTRWILVP